MRYKIVKVTDHNGDMTPEMKARVGRVMNIEPEDIVIGVSNFFECIDPGYMKSIITSSVRSVDCDDKTLTIKTKNTIYQFEKD